MYESEAEKNGKVFIFNNVEFDDTDLVSREGSDKDERDLRDVFGNHGYDVAEEMKNLSLIEFLTEIKKISKQDFTDYKCMIAIFLSHGEKDQIHMKDDSVVLDLIPKHFRGDKCSSLNDKPKIFIFQACRGVRAEKTAYVRTMRDQQPSGDIQSDSFTFSNPKKNKTSVEEDAGISCTVPAGADFVMCFASSEGYVSFRDKTNGSLYIQNLVSTLKDYFNGENADTFLDLMTSVSDQVSEFSCEGRKQMPCITSMLRKKFSLPK